MAYVTRYPLPQITYGETIRTDDGRWLKIEVKAINWRQIIGAMKLREMERRVWQEELSVWLDE